MERFLKADWPAPRHVYAYTTLRSGGFSTGAHASFNMVFDVGDSDHAVIQNRQLLEQSLQLPSSPKWLKQVHGKTALNAQFCTPLAEADASYSFEPNTVCTVTTADCLPVLICNQQGTTVAAIHAGWKGLLAGIIGNTIKQLNQTGQELMAWLGPAISAEVFEVGHEVYEAFVTANKSYGLAFKVKNEHKWLADLYHIARMQLHESNITAIYGGNFCTYQDTQRFYSYRRDGRETGRMATLIWYQV